MKSFRRQKNMEWIFAILAMVSFAVSLRKSWDGDVDSAIYWALSAIVLIMLENQCHRDALEALEPLEEGA